MILYNKIKRSMGIFTVELELEDYIRTELANIDFLTANPIMPTITDILKHQHYLRFKQELYLNAHRDY